MWEAATLVNTLRIAKIISDLHADQYAGSIPSDHITMWSNTVNKSKYE